MAPMINIAHMLPRSCVNGPGERFVVWVQGCSLHCRGCWNPDTWNTRAGTLVDVHSLIAEIEGTSAIEGVTLTGGEPFEQSEPLAVLARAVRERGLSVMAFTGYELDELQTSAQRQLVALCDVVVAGRYVQTRRLVGERWRGSANQSIHFLSPRYAPEDAGLVECEFHLYDDGRVVVTGFPPHQLRGLG